MAQHFQSPDVRLHFSPLIPGYGVMDHQSQIPSNTNSLKHYEEPYAASTKKRKLQQGKSDFPTSKYKTHDRTSGSDNESSREDSIKAKAHGKSIERERDAYTNDEQEILVESDEGSNSFVGRYDTTMVLEMGSETSELSFREVLHPNQPSTSPGSSYNNNALRIPLCASDNRSMNDTDADRQATLNDDRMEGAAKIEPKHTDMNLGHDTTTKPRVESNDVTSSDGFILSSERWLVGRDARRSAKRMTIDKEFEQYFSSIMF